MSTAPLVLLLANAGIGSAAARASKLSEPQVRALAAVSRAIEFCPGADLAMDTTSAIVEGCRLSRGFGSLLAGRAGLCVEGVSI